YKVIIRGTSAHDVLRPRDVTASPSVGEGKSMLQPLRELFKEEIRHIGEALGMAPEVYLAQPFPGTGLALRIVGEVTHERLAVLRKCDAIFREEITLAGLGKRLWKYFAFMYHFPQENRDNAAVIGLRAVSASSAAGGMRALPARLPYDLLERCVERIMAECPDVIKVYQDLTPSSILKDIDWQ
ncbi:MAG: GMP synthase (glutamine-hydrolyzing), partial [Clostridiales bacterium]|nr:GMP synthase (glutamine-hydrolyzing) [Clostridiales bacterium]